MFKFITRMMQTLTKTTTTINDEKHKLKNMHFSFSLCRQQFYIPNTRFLFQNYSKTYNLGATNFA